ncbi:hypothetical protein [Streptomyces sp. NPDC002403]
MGIEIFTLAAPDGSPLGHVAARERVNRHEAHLALDVAAPDDVVLGGLRALLAGLGDAARRRLI